jgi:asparagine synthase (glutamine-hydrolysing)
VINVVGIFGLFCREKDYFHKEKIEDLVNIMKHEDSYVETIGLTSGFMGTVELFSSKGKNSAVFDRDSSLCGVSRGRVNNKKELNVLGIVQSADTEDETNFFIRLYKAKGLEFAKYINGLFNLAINDEKKGRIILINDRFGFYPLYYALSDGMFAFASEAKFVLKATNMTPKIDRRAVSEFFTLSFLLGDKTFFEGVRLMKPASIIVLYKKENKIETMQYWDFSVPKRRFNVQDNLFEEFRRLMEKAIERSIRGSKKVGVFLSGGLDSRAIAAFASKSGAEVVAFSFGPKDSFEQKIAMQVAQRLNIKIVVREIPSDFIANYAEEIVYRGDGMIRIRDCHFIALLDEVKSMVDVVLLGTFGGELFGSKVTKKLRNIKSKEEVISYLFQKNAIGIQLKEYQKVFEKCFVNERSKLLERFRETFDQIPFDNPEDIVEYWEYRNRQVRYIFQSFQYLNWFFETRHPFLDADLVEFFAFKLPFNMRINERFLQKAINYCFPSLSDIPWERTGAPLDPDILTMWFGRGKLFLKSKMGLILEKVSKGKIKTAPRDYRLYNQWLRTGSKDYVTRLLLDHRTLNRGFLKPSYVKQVLQEHMNYQRNRDQLLCDLINFELLNRIFFEDFR